MRAEVAEGQGWAFIFLLPRRFEFKSWSTLLEDKTVCRVEKDRGSLRKMSILLSFLSLSVYIYIFFFLPNGNYGSIMQTSVKVHRPCTPGLIGT